MEFIFQGYFAENEESGCEKGTCRFYVSKISRYDSTLIKIND